MQAKNGLRTPKTVIASAAWQSMLACAPITYGSPRRSALRDDGLMKIAPQQINQ